MDNNQLPIWVFGLGQFLVMLLLSLLAWVVLLKCCVFTVSFLLALWPW